MYLRYTCVAIVLSTLGCNRSSNDFASSIDDVIYGTVTLSTLERIGGGSVGYSLGIRTDGDGNEELLFIHIHRSTAGSSQCLVSNGVSSDGSRWIRLYKPNGESVSLPGDNNLFQIYDGKYSEAKCELTLEDWESFRNSYPEDISIGCIMRFLENRRFPGNPSSSE